MNRIPGYRRFLSLRSLFCLIAALLSGCGNYALIRPLNGNMRQSEELQWRRELEPRLPCNRIEELVVKAAINRRSMVEKDLLVAYVSDDKIDALVVTVEENEEREEHERSDCFATKKIVRYLVASGRIHAVQGPCLEPFPDVSFERSVMSTAVKAAAEGGMTVVLLREWTQPVALKGVVYGGCVTEVTAFVAGNNGPGDRLCSKRVNICKPE